MRRFKPLKTGNPMFVCRVCRAASAAGLIAFGLVLLTGSGRVQAAPEDWYEFVGGQLAPGGGPGGFSGSSDAGDYRNWYSSGAGGFATSISAVTNPPNFGLGQRWGFTSGGGYSEVGGTGSSTWFSTGPPSNNYPGNSGPLVTNPVNINITASDGAINFGAGTSGDIDGDAHVYINGGTLTCGPLTSNGAYGAWLPPFGSYTGGYMWNNTIDVLNSGVMTGGSVGGFFQGGSPSVGDITLGVHDTATVTLAAYTAGHTAGSYGGGGSAGAGNTGNGLGGGGLTLEGSGGTVNISHVYLLPSNPSDVSNRSDFCAGAALNVKLDSTCLSSAGTVSFNTVNAASLELDPTYLAGTNYNSPVNLQVTMEGCTPKANDVIPVIAVSGGTAGLGHWAQGTGYVTGSLGTPTFNGQTVAWGSPFGVGTFNPITLTYPYTMKALQQNPDNPSQYGVYLEVISTPQVLGVWTGGGANTSWFTTGNWSSAGVPGSTTPAPFDTADFPAGLSVTATTTVTLDGTAGTLSAITINDGAGTIEPYSISQGSTGGGSITLSTTSGGVAQITVSGGTNNSISANLVLASSSGVFTSASSSLALSGSSITGAGPLIVTGSGTLLLTGTGTISSTTNVPSSTLEVDGQWTTETLNVTLNSNGTGQGTGQLAGSGTITLTGADGMFYNSSLRSRFTGNLIFSNPTAGLEVDGGVLILSGSNTYDGTTSIANLGTGGELVLNSNTALPPQANVVIGPGGTLIYDPNITSSPVYSSQAGPATVPEPGTLALLVSGALIGGLAWRRRRKGG